MDIFRGKKKEKRYNKIVKNFTSNKKQWEHISMGESIIKMPISILNCGWVFWWLFTPEYAADLAIMRTWEPGDTVTIYERYAVLAETWSTALYMYLKDIFMQNVPMKSTLSVNFTNIYLKITSIKFIESPLASHIIQTTSNRIDYLIKLMSL